MQDSPEIAACRLLLRCSLKDAINAKLVFSGTNSAEELYSQSLAPQSSPSLTSRERSSQRRCSPLTATLAHVGHLHTGRVSSSISMRPL